MRFCVVREAASRALVLFLGEGMQVIGYRGRPKHSCEVVGAVSDRSVYPAVRGYLGFRLDADVPWRRLELPSATATLLLNLGAPLRVTHLRTGRSSTIGSGAVTVFGVNTAALVGEHTGRLLGLRVVLSPWAAFGLFGDSMDRLSDTVAELPDLLGIPAATLVDEFTGSGDWREGMARVEMLLARLSTEGRPASPRLVEAWRLLCLADGRMSIRTLADEVGWSQRQLESRFHQQVGLSPKAATRVLRLDRALRLLTCGRTAADAAFLAGYHDQSHFSRECKAMIGHTPGQYRDRFAATDLGPAVGERVTGWPLGGELGVTVPVGPAG